MTVQHRAAITLRAAADSVRVQAYAALDEGRAVDYDALCRREAELTTASGWAATATAEAAAQLARGHALRLLEEDDVDTVRVPRLR